MAESYTVVVAGAGPGGCIFARDLARAGVSVVVYEKGTLEDLGHNWSDAVERKALDEVGLAVPPEGTVNRGELVKKFPGTPTGSSRNIRIRRWMCGRRTTPAARRSASTTSPRTGGPWENSW